MFRRRWRSVVLGEGCKEGVLRGGLLSSESMVGVVSGARQEKDGSTWCLRGCLCGRRDSHGIQDFVVVTREKGFVIVTCTYIRFPVHRLASLSLSVDRFQRVSTQMLDGRWGKW